MSEGTVGQVARTDAQMPALAPQDQQTQIPAKIQQSTQSKQPQSVDLRQAKRAAVPAKERISLDELADMLRKLNLTFDLFEIESEFSVDLDDHQVRVVVRNTRTNEVIRRIPAHEFEAQFTNFRDGVGLLIDSFL